MDNLTKLKIDPMKKQTLQDGKIRSRTNSPQSEISTGQIPYGAKKNSEFKEFKEKVLDLSRVARVMAGGKRFRFRATIVIGDRNGRVGIGIGKGIDVAQSVDKAKMSAKKKLINVNLKQGTILHEVKEKFGAAQIIIKPAKHGHGLKAGGAVRTVLLLAGVKDATAKCLGGTKNKLTNAMAAIEALKKMKINPVRSQNILMGDNTNKNATS